MPPIERSDLNQTAVLWSRNGYDRYGQPTTTSPIEIPVRWSGKKSEVVGPQGNKIAIDATAVTDVIVSIGSHIWRGTLNEWYQLGSAGQPNDLMEVKTIDVTPDIDAKNYRITIGMMRLHDASTP